MAFDPEEIHISYTGTVRYREGYKLCLYDTCSKFKKDCEYALTEETKDHICNAFKTKFPNSYFRTITVDHLTGEARCYVKKLKLIEAIQKYL